MNKKTIMQTIVIIVLLGITIVLAIINFNNKNSEIEKQETSKKQATTSDTYVDMKTHLSQVGKPQNAITGQANLQSTKGSDATAAQTTYPEFTIDVTDYSKLAVNVTYTYSDQEQLEISTDDGSVAVTVGEGTFEYDISNATTLKFAHQCNRSKETDCIFEYTITP